MIDNEQDELETEGAVAAAEEILNDVIQTEEDERSSLQEYIVRPKRRRNKTLIDHLFGFSFRWAYAGKANDCHREGCATPIAAGDPIMRGFRRFKFRGRFWMTRWQYWHLGCFMLYVQSWFAANPRLTHGRTAVLNLSAEGFRHRNIALTRLRYLSTWLDKFYASDEEVELPIWKLRHHYMQIIDLAIELESLGGIPEKYEPLLDHIAQRMAQWKVEGVNLRLDWNKDY